MKINMVKSGEPILADILDIEKPVVCFNMECTYVAELGCENCICADEEGCFQKEFTYSISELEQQGRVIND